jgi:hypothetical protein
LRVVRVTETSEYHQEATRRNVCSWQILLQKSQKALPLISRQRTKQATIADQCSLKPVTGIACEFDAWWRSPPRFYSIAAPAAKRI